MTPKALTTVLATLAILAASFILSLVVSRRGKKTSTGDATDDWNIGGRSLPLFVVIGTQFASAMGGGVLVGQVGNAYNNGLADLFILCGATVSDFYADRQLDPRKRI